MMTPSSQARSAFGSAMLAVLVALLLTTVSGAVAQADDVMGSVLTNSYSGRVERGYRQRGSYRRSAGYRRSASHRKIAGYRRGGARRSATTRARGGYAARRGGHSSGGVRWVASAGCLNPSLRAVVYAMAQYGSVTVSSTCRSHSRNRRVGGARKSYHLGGNAVDFRIRGNVRAAYAALRAHGSVGGLKHYGGGLFHIDTGPRRSF